VSGSKEGASGAQGDAAAETDDGISDAGASADGASGTDAA
jgi:hypothetical protein